MTERIFSGTMYKYVVTFDKEKYKTGSIELRIKIVHVVQVITDNLLFCVFRTRTLARKMCVLIE